MSSKRGVFVSFESIDGLGKTTQLRLLGETLTTSGYDVVLRREPGSANVGEGIRDLLFKSPTTKEMAPGVADALFLSDHIQNAADIASYVEEGKVVLCDRYADSQFAYACSIGKNCPPWALEAYEKCFGLVPDITVLLVARSKHTTRKRGAAPSTAVEDIGWALERAQRRRGVEAGKQDGKAWNNVEDQLRIQHGYLQRLGDQTRTLIVEVYENDDIETVRNNILDGIVQRGLLEIYTAPVAA